MRKSWKLAVAAMGVTMLMSAGTVMAQDNTQPQQGQQQPGQRGNRGNRGAGGGNFDPAQFRQQMMDRMKQQLGATDEEWTALQPKIQKVMDAQRDTRGGRGGFGGGRRGGTDNNNNGQQPQQPQSDVAKASAELRTALDNKDTPPAEIQQKLAALRDAREKAKANLTAAQKELKELLTARQEATLVNMGMLE